MNDSINCEENVEKIYLVNHWYNTNSPPHIIFKLSALKRSIIILWLYSCDFVGKKGSAH